MTTSRPSIVDCSEATIRDGTFSDPPAGRVYYDFTDGTLGDVTLAFETAPFEHCKFSRTTFDGFQFSIAEHVTALRGSWTLHATADSPFDPEGYGTIENTYLKAKNGALDNGEGEPASEFFRREMKYRRKAHLEGVLTDDERSQVRSAVRWAMNWGYNVTCGYGERPLWTIGVSGASIVLFAAWFRAAGVSMPSW